MPEAFRVRSALLWSTLYVPAGSELAFGQHHLFIVGLGQTGQGKASSHTIADTNLKEPMRVLGALDVKSIAWQIIHPSQVFREQAAHNAAWVWDFAQCIVDGSPLDMVSLGEPEIVPAESQAPRDTTYGRISFDKPVSIPDGSSFAIRLQFGQAQPGWIVPTSEDYLDTETIEEEIDRPWWSYSGTKMTTKTTRAVVRARPLSEPLRIRFILGADWRVPLEIP